MKTYKSKLNDFEASVTVPDVWTSEHVFLYMDALSEIGKADGEARLVFARFGAVMALVAAGIVEINVPGIDVSEGDVDVKALDMRALTFLVQTVALPIEATQSVPFELSES